MAKFVAQRAASAVLVLFVMSVIVFYAMRAAPGSVTSQLVNPANSYSVYLLPHLRHILGLDRPLLMQYLVFIGHVLSGRPGVSLISGAPISHIIATAGLNTLKLAGMAVAFTYVTAVPVGLLAASRQNSAFDHGAMLLAVVGMGVPNFFLGVVFIQLFTIRFHVLPLGTPGWESAVLPAAVLAAEAIAINVRMVRSSVLEQLRRDYVLVLRAKGVSPFRIVAVHAFRNSLPPVLALAGIMLRSLLAYTMIVEVVFRWPGLGYQLVESILNRDYTLSQVLALLLTFLVILFNLLADIGQHWADPRTREAALAGSPTR